MSGRCETIEGSFFEAVPAGDGYVLKHILHDWSDDQCRRILGNCRRAIAKGGRLMVVEILIPPGDEPHYGKSLDVNMLVLTTGRERTEEEYRGLFEASGFSLSRVILTSADLSIIEGAPA